MNVAVLTLTRDRLDYTRHCFASLVENAGCDYDHFVLDNGSSDGTREWLAKYQPTAAVFLDENIGIARGLNHLLDICKPSRYDVIVHFDNDCEVVQPNTLRDLAALVDETGWFLSPRILGLQNPPQPVREVQHNGEVILELVQIGGIFLAAPASVYDTYRYPGNLPVWGMDDAHICHWYRQQGGACGYVKRLEAWHYETTAGQRDRHPDYWARKDREMGLVAA